MLADKTLVLATQLSENNKALLSAAEQLGIGSVYKTLGAGYHVETTLYILHNDLAKVGASQGVCPDCREFLKARGIERFGGDRETPDQAWRSPEHYNNEEKNPIDAKYPWAFLLDDISGTRLRFETKDQHAYLVDQRVNKKNIGDPVNILKQYPGPGKWPPGEPAK